ncbi:peroxiredoxin-like family protein [Salinarimonas rosea]|uniref:peroxiredoxin-like family protein n=1 Tax=Salinarimonas rosea TaxID=552063 RepID=UPI00048C27E8|nr:peroxiredoxin-like family protein [Salinarimonas rosea]
MPDIRPLTPRRPVPPLQLPLAGGGRFDIAEEAPRHFTLLVFYRGLHCPICKVQLRELERQLGAFAERGVGVVAVSSDDEERGERTKPEWGLSALRVAYGLDLETARRWGLYVSTGRGTTSAGIEEPALFSEPALYLVRADGTLYFGAVQTMPFARPHLSDVIGAIDFVLAKDYPARGEVESLSDPSR